MCGYLGAFFFLFFFFNKWCHLICPTLASCCSRKYVHTERKTALAKTFNGGIQLHQNLNSVISETHFPLNVHKYISSWDKHVIEGNLYALYQ